MLGQVGEQDIVKVDPRLVLCRDENGVQRHGLVALVHDAHLSLAVRSQIRQLAGAPDLGESFARGGAQARSEEA